MKQQSRLINLKDFTEHSTYFADFYRLFHRITQLNRGQSGKVVYVTSATAGEGKTTVATFLALTASLSSHSHYLLIDGDLHRPSVHERFNCARENGITEVLLGERECGDVIFKTGYRGLHIITAGKSVHSPFQLFSTERIKKLLNEMKNYYEIIIIDGPPLGPVSDSLKLAQMADGTILVVKAGRTPRAVASHAVSILKDANLPLWGVVLNDTGEVLPYYYQPKYHDARYYMVEQETEK
jgi:capsular exopolysaccharide synthesis family protein